MHTAHKPPPKVTPAPGAKTDPAESEAVPDPAPPAESETVSGSQVDAEAAGTAGETSPTISGDSDTSSAPSTGKPPALKHGQWVKAVDPEQASASRFGLTYIFLLFDICMLCLVLTRV